MIATQARNDDKETMETATESSYTVEVSLPTLSIDVLAPDHDAAIESAIQEAMDTVHEWIAAAAFTARTA